MAPVAPTTRHPRADRKELFDLLAQVDPEALAHLERLERDLEDPEAVLPSTESVVLLLNPTSIGEHAEAGFGRGARVLEQIRNVLTIAPLAVTWLSLGLATANYSYVAERGLVDPQETFLTLWQSGFGGRGIFPAPSFTETAFVDVILLISLLIASVFFQWAAGRAQARGREVRLRLERYIPPLLGRIERRRAEADREALRAALAAGVADLRTATADLKESTGSLAAQAIGARAASDEVRRIADGLLTAVRELSGVRGDLRSTLAEVVRRSADQQEAARNLLTAQAGLQGALGDLADRLRDEAWQGVARADELHRAVEDRQHRLDEVTAARQRQVDELIRAVADQGSELQKKLGLLVLRIPSARMIADEIAGAWALAEAQHLDRLNRQLSDTLASFVRVAEARSDPGGPGEDTLALLRGLIDRLDRISPGEAAQGAEAAPEGSPPSGARPAAPALPAGDPE